MDWKQVSIIINPRTGQNVTRLPGILAVMAAAGWQTQVALKEYAGHTMHLTQQACANGQELIIGYGGDGTLNQVLNGVLQSNQQKNKIVGIIPGGTANLWAGDVGIPTDPVLAALSLLNSRVHQVDVGQVTVHSITSPDAEPQFVEQQVSKKAQKKLQRKSRDHFLLMAGLGFDAAVMDTVSKQLKHKVGPLAVGLSAARHITTQQPFSVTLQAHYPQQPTRTWQGEAIQVIIGNTRRYAMILETTPNASIDDGLLDACIISAGHPLNTVQQITDLVLHRQTETSSVETFQAPMFDITLPASVPLEVDGSTISVKSLLPKKQARLLKQAKDLSQVRITYRFTARPGILHIALPASYNSTLFENPQHEYLPVPEAVKQELPLSTEQGETVQPAPEFHEQVQMILAQGRTVQVQGTTVNPAGKDMLVLAGETRQRRTGDIKPVAVTVNNKTALFHKQGTGASQAELLQLKDNARIVITGKKSRRGVIHAQHLVLL